MYEYIKIPWTNQNWLQMHYLAVFSSLNDNVGWNKNTTCIINVNLILHALYMRLEFPEYQSSYYYKCEVWEFLTDVFAAYELIMDELAVNSMQRTDRNTDNIRT